MSSAQERFEEFMGGEPRLAQPWEERNAGRHHDFLAGYAAGAEDMRNKCVTSAILELEGTPSMVHVAETLAALPAQQASEEQSDE